MSAKLPETHQLTDGRQLVLRKAMADDATALLDYVETICSESDFLSFGPGEFDLTQAEEEELLAQAHDADNQLFLLGQIDDEIVSTLHFFGGSRPRLRHVGEFGVSVRQSHWGLGIATRMIDGLIDWARASEVVKKINLRVRSDNVRAIRLYERKGFAHEGTIRKDICIRGQFYDHHCMGLEI